MPNGVNSRFATLFLAAALVPSCRRPAPDEIELVQAPALSQSARSSDSATVVSEVFAYTDDEGVIHFSNSPFKGAVKFARTKPGGGSTAAARPKPKEATRHELTPEDLFEQVSPGVVTVKVNDDDELTKVVASGVIVAHERVVTSAHVVEGGGRVLIAKGGHKWKAMKAAVSLEADIALLFVPGLGLGAVNLSESEPRVGQRVYAIGTPRELDETLSDGLVSSLRVRNGRQYIQFTAPISQGSSGGGVFNSCGELIGIATSTLMDGQNINFAVPVKWVTQVLGVAVPQPTAMVASAPRRVSFATDLGAIGPYREAIAAAASRYRIPEALVAAIVLVLWDGKSVVPDAAGGVMRLSETVSAEMGVAKAATPSENIEGGARYLRVLANEYAGDPVLTIAAFYAGPKAVRDAGGVVPSEPKTRDFVRRVVSGWKELEARAARYGMREDAP